MHIIWRRFFFFSSFHKHSPLFRSVRKCSTVSCKISAFSNFPLWGSLAAAGTNLRSSPRDAFILSRRFFSIIPLLRFRDACWQESPPGELQLCRTEQWKITYYIYDQFTFPIKACFFSLTKKSNQTLIARLNILNVYSRLFAALLGEHVVAIGIAHSSFQTSLLMSLTLLRRLLLLLPALLIPNIRDVHLEIRELVTRSNFRGHVRPHQILMMPRHFRPVQLGRLMPLHLRRRLMS